MSKAKEEVLLAHGSGGRLSQDLFRNLFQPYFQNTFLNQVHDGAVIELSGKKLAFSTDTFVVNPIFFPGGNIGDLAINGTVNDLAMCGAEPRYLSVGFILEEGFSLPDLRKIVESMQAAAGKAGVLIVTGDTKVVEKGKADGVFVNTSGVGLVDEEVSISPAAATAGDAIIINGKIAEHGMAVMTKREGLDFETDIVSDSAALNGLTQSILKFKKDLRVLRDPTRGGVAASLNEIAQASQKGVVLEEKKIPIAEAVKTAAAILGIDPLYVANEGKLLAIVAENKAEEILETMRKTPEGRESAIIGRVTDEHKTRVVMKTAIGAKRLVDMPVGEQLPRIC